MGRKDTIGRRTPGDSVGAADASALLDLCRPLLEAAPLPMAAVEGPQHRVRSVNLAFCRLIGATQEAVIGRPVLISTGFAARISSLVKTLLSIVALRLTISQAAR